MTQQGFIIFPPQSILELFRVRTYFSDVIDKD